MSSSKVIRSGRKPLSLLRAIWEKYGFKNPEDQLKGCCRVCLKVLPGPSRRMCSPECTRSWNHAMRMTPQEFVMMRDGGVCACCGMNTWKLVREHAEQGAVPTMMTEKLSRMVKHARETTEKAKAAQDAAAQQAALEHLLEKWDMPTNRTSLVEIDHRIPFELWTGDPVEANAPTNLQTLAIPCHKEKCAREAVLRSKRRRTRKKEGPKMKALREQRERTLHSAT